MLEALIGLPKSWLRASSWAVIRRRCRQVDAPTSVTVTKGTLLRGDVASLAATDGNTLDIQSVFESSNNRYWVAFTVDFAAGAGTQPRTIHWTVTVVDGSGRARCRFPGSANYGGIAGTPSGVIPNQPAGAFTASVTCKTKIGGHHPALKMYWDEFSING